MTVARCLSAFMVMLLACGQLSARGGYHSEDRYNPQHIASLRLEVRDSVVQRCSTPRALHSFAIYFDNLKGVVLHVEYLLCDGNSADCPALGCLHQVWVSEGGHYRLLRSYYAPAGD